MRCVVAKYVVQINAKLGNENHADGANTDDDPYTRYYIQIYMHT